ncbi:MAG: DUF1592 domain-containing protein [Pseudohongiellaceae bacterium]
MRSTALFPLTIATVVLVAVFVGTLAASRQVMAASVDEETFTAADMREVVNTYCLVCHSDALPTAGLSLQSMDFADPGNHMESLELVVKKLRAHMMPPAGLPRPEFATYELMTGWLEAELDRAWDAKPNPGRVTPVHRMNRYEYNNAVNDLLGLDVDVMSLLPGDPTADGSFDNMAESLPFTTAHMERYMSVARQVTRLATGLPPVGPTITGYEIPLHVAQDWRQNEEVPFGSRGGIGVSHHFPVDGDYLIRVHLERNYQDYIKGLGWPQQLEIRLDGRLLKRFTIGGEAPGTPAPLSFSGTGEPGSIDWEEYMLTHAEAGLEVRVPVKAGPGTLAVSYVRQQWEPEGIPQPVQQGRLYANDEAYMDNQKVYLVEVGGPYFSTGSPPDSSTGIARDTPSRRNIFTCHPEQGAEEMACVTEILSRMARNAYRRAVTDDDLTLLLSFYDRGREQGGSFDAGVQLALEFMLSDPDFLIRTYHDPPQAEQGQPFRLSDSELASRLSFFLWSTAPDETLLELAEQGRLSDEEILTQQARRMLADPRGVTTLVEDFAAQWLNLRRLDEVQINTVVFPEYDLSLMESFRHETELFIGGTLRSDTSILELLSADYTYLNERLARHYGIPGIYGSRFRKAALPDTSQRGGLLANGALLTVTSYPGRTSPVLRGKWLLDNMLGTPPPPPPANVPILPDAEAGEVPTSIRERLTRHREDPVCASCHNVIDPLGFALENFDVIGAWRHYDEVGNPVDPDGTYPGDVTFGGFADLRDWMLERPDRFAHTLTEKLMAYALGRRVDYFDQPAIRQIVRDAAADNYTWSSLILGIVQSPPFLMSMPREVTTQ